MVRRNFREKMNSKEGHQPLDDLTTKDCSLGSFSTAERINKLEKILALVNSPHNGEAMSAARMLMKLSKAWRIDLGLFRDPSGQKVETLVDGVVSSNSGHYFSPHVREYPDPGTRPRTIPTFVKAHSRRRHGGPPFPVRPHRRRRRTRLRPARGTTVRIVSKPDEPSSRPSASRLGWSRTASLGRRRPGEVGEVLVLGDAQQRGGDVVDAWCREHVGAPGGEAADLDGERHLRRVGPVWGSPLGRAVVGLLGELDRLPSGPRRDRRRLDGALDETDGRAGVDLDASREADLAVPHDASPMPSVRSSTAPSRRASRA